MKIHQKRALNKASTQGNPSYSSYYGQFYHNVHSYIVGSVASQAYPPSPSSSGSGQLFSVSKEEDSTRRRRTQEEGYRRS
jgi:hypothetical protein